MSKDRTVKRVKVYVKSEDENVLKIKQITFKENKEPKPEDQIAVSSPYADFNGDEYVYEDTAYGSDNTPVLTAGPNGLGWGAGGGLYMQISIMGSVYADSSWAQGPPIKVPRNCRVTEIVSYSRYGTCTVVVRLNMYSMVAIALGQTLIKDQVLHAYVTVASGGCEDVIVQVRCA